MYPWGGNADRVASISPHTHCVPNSLRTHAFHFYVASKLGSASCTSHKWSLSINVGSLHWFKSPSFSQRDDWQLPFMSRIWKENVTCLFLKVNSLKVIHFLLFSSFLQIDVSIQPMSPCMGWGGGCAHVCGTALIRIHAGVRSAWQDRCRQCCSVRWRTGRTRTYGHILYIRGVSELEAGEGQYCIRQESGLQEVDMPGRIMSAAPCKPDLNAPASFALFK